MCRKYRRSSLSSQSIDSDASIWNSQDDTGSFLYMHTQSMAGDLAANVQDVQPTIRDEALYTRDPVDQSWQPGKLLNVYTGKASVWVGKIMASPGYPAVFPPDVW